MTQLRRGLFATIDAVLFPTALTAVCAAILDDNPGHFSYDINDTYPKRRPLSSVPPGILMLLPRLPGRAHNLLC